MNSIFDIGLQKTSENSYFKELTELIPHIVTIIDSETYRIQYINHYFADLDESKVIGKEFFEFVAPDFIQPYREKLRSIKQNFKQDTIELEGVSYTNQSGKAWYRTYITPLTENNKIYSFLLISEDITENKEKELEIINKSEKIKSILNNTKDIICSIDKDYNLTEFNTVYAGMVKTGYGVEMKAGMPILNFIDPKKHDKIKSLYRKVLSGEILTDNESFETPYGPRYYETNYHPIYNFNNEIVGISIFSKDVSYRKHNEEKTIASLKEKELLLSEIHHRIKNNLAIVSSMLQLQEMNIDFPEVKDALSQSRNRIKSTALVHELLYNSDSFQNIQIHDYITKLFANLNVNNNKSIELIGDPITLNIKTAMPLGLLLNELMMNSFKHSYKQDEKGNLRISTSLKDKTLLIDYSDSKGIFPESINFMDPKTTGLLLIHTFIQQLEGEINLTNHQPPGFSIRLPLHEE